MCERPHNLYHEGQQQNERLIVKKVNMSHKASEVSVLRDSCTQWHHGEPQHDGTESYSDLLGQREASFSMFGDTHLCCRLLLPLTETSFFAE